MFVGAIRRAAQIRGTAAAMLFAGRRRTWKQTEERTARLAAALRELGVKPRDRVGLLGLNSDNYLEAMHATWWCGAVTVPMNTRWAVPEHLFSITDAQISVVFADDGFVDTARELLAQASGIRLLVYFGASRSPQGFVSMEKLIETHEPGLPVPSRNEELTGILYTGGTTGLPKGVMHSQASLWAGAMSIAYSANIPDAPRYLHAAPMFHLGDLAHGLYTTALGGTHVIIPSFSAAAVCNAVRAHDPQYSLMVPTMIGLLINSPEFSPKDFVRFRQIIYGGSPITDAVRTTVRQVLPGVRLLQGFGQTESVGCGTIMPAHALANLSLDHQRHRSAGCAAYGVEIQIVTEEGHVASPGELGEIWLRSASAMLGYLNRPDETRRALADGWVHTGDAGYLDGEGFLFICDRLKDMIITGGENVFSAEVENAVAGHPAVAQAAVIGVPDETWGERVHAVVVLRPGMTLDLQALQRHCRAAIANYKIPRSMELRDTALPVSPVGKVLKSKLREPHWRNQTRGVH